MTTATDVLTNLDAQLDDTVPCEWDTDDAECDQPAEWIIRYSVGWVGGPHHLFACTPHKEFMIGHATTCPNCSRIITVQSVEAIR